MRKLTRLLAVIHRWVGISMCLLFAAWFVSGIVLIYVPFPSLANINEADKVRQSVDPDTVLVGPIAAIRHANRAETIERIRLLKPLEDPVYVFEYASGPISAVSATSGALLTDIGDSGARRIAQSFTGEAVLDVTSPIYYDQWIVPNEYDAFRPFYKATLGDGQGSELYISARSGEPLQWTRRKERIWNYFGAIVHWIYPTVIRRNWHVWDQTVWWLSLTGILLVLAGLVLGTVRFRAARRSRQPRVSPYSGWMRWHHLIGLFGGVLVLTWITSGWLSMDHGRLFSLPTPTEAAARRFQGIPLADAAGMIGIDSIQKLPAFESMEIGAINRQPVVTLLVDGQISTYLHSTGSLQKVAGIPNATIGSAVEAGWPLSEVTKIKVPGEDDAYSHLLTGATADSIVRVVLDDPSSTWVHVDRKTGDILSVMDQSRRIYRWLFNGLHSLDFPYLASSRPLWDFTILALLSVGLLFSLSAVIIGRRRLARSLRRFGKPDR